MMAVGPPSGEGPEKSPFSSAAVGTTVLKGELAWVSVSSQSVKK